MTERRAARAHEGMFLRRLAHWGASRGPEWWVRYTPPFFGWAAAALVPSARRAVLRNLRLVRGPASPLQDARDTLETFANYASCLAEVLSNDAPQGPRPAESTIINEKYMHDARAADRGIIVVTGHTAGWESVGPLLAHDQGLDVTIVMQAEPDARARALQDEVRRRAGVRIVHAGDDPFSALTLLRALRMPNAVVALQLDRFAPRMKTRTVDLLGEPAELPDGPLRLAQASGAPVVAVFCARLGYRRYVVEVFPAIHVSRRADEEELDRAAQLLADRLAGFLRQHPTQWFHFHT
ncbi:MAG: Lipid biosynthesis lauroyl acyltransferase [Labilithrix sp.]|nr:Lipid biosynthesis lauroyl acyltransferase [Labilithrix sp.]